MLTSRAFVVGLSALMGTAQAASFHFGLEDMDAHDNLFADGAGEKAFEDALKADEDWVDTDSRRLLQATAGSAWVAAPPTAAGPMMQEGFNCKTRELWTKEKRAWCCKNEGLGCRPDESTKAAAKASMEKTFNCKTREVWTAAKAAYCCKTEGLGCTQHNSGAACAPVSCYMFCENGFAKDDKGCDMCQCAEEEKETECPPVMCMMYCDTGFEQDENGCDICRCKSIHAAQEEEDEYIWVYEWEYYGDSDDHEHDADGNHIRPVPSGMLGGTKDEFGCIGSAGYTWCAHKNKCLRTFEEPCVPSGQWATGGSGSAAWGGEMRGAWGGAKGTWAGMGSGAAAAGSWSEGDEW